MEIFDKEKIQKFENFYNLLIETNKLFNLTTITEKNEVFEKHFFDSCHMNEVFTKNSTVIDVGTGAGFPSVPLAIVRNDLKITAIDALQKRINFVNEVKNKLSLENLEVYHSRSEEFILNNREKFDYATSRALAELNTLLEWLAPFVKVGGWVICYKGSKIVNHDDEEIKNAKSAAKELGLSFCEVKSYILPESKAIHTLVIYKKIKPTPVKYPRGQNKAKTEPIK